MDIQILNLQSHGGMQDTLTSRQSSYQLRVPRRSEVRLGTQHSQLIVVAKVAIIIADNQGRKEQLTFETAVPALNHS